MYIRVKNILLQRTSLIALLLILAFLVLTIALACTRPPHTDEGHFANAASIFLHDGRLAMPMWAPWIPSLETKMYVTTPLYFVSLGGWFAIFGDSWAAIRMFSVLWGVVLIVSWFITVRTLLPRTLAPILALMLVAINYDVINISTARYDVMSAGLGAAALAMYLSLRSSNLARAVLLSATLLTAACLTHPYGVIHAAACVLVAIRLDLSRLRIAHVALAGLPVIVGLAGWGIYILQDLPTFREQFGNNSGGRLSSLAHPIQSLIDELKVRYLIHIAGWRADQSMLLKTKSVWLVVYIVGVLLAVSSRRCRRDIGVSTLLLYALGCAALLWLIEGYKWYVYTIHLVPGLAALTATAIATVDVRPVVRSSLLVLLLIAVGQASAAVGYRVMLNVHGRAYSPASRYLQQNVEPSDLVFAGAEFGVGLDYEKHVLDDPTLGFQNGKRARFIVLSRDFDPRTYRSSPANQMHVDSVLSQYQTVFETEAAGHYYRILRRSEPAP